MYIALLLNEIDDLREQLQYPTEIEMSVRREVADEMATRLAHMEVLYKQMLEQEIKIIEEKYECKLKIHQESMTLRTGTDYTTLFHHHEQLKETHESLVSQLREVTIALKQKQITIEQLTLREQQYVTRISELEVHIQSKAAQNDVEAAPVSPRQEKTNVHSEELIAEQQAKKPKKYGVKRRFEKILSPIVEKKNEKKQKKNNNINLVEPKSVEVDTVKENLSPNTINFKSDIIAHASPLPQRHKTKLRRIIQGHSENDQYNGSPRLDRSPLVVSSPRSPAHPYTYTLGDCQSPKLVTPIAKRLRNKRNNTNSNKRYRV